jgi:hypothetical protein
MWQALLNTLLKASIDIEQMIANAGIITFGNVLDGMWHLCDTDVRRSYTCAQPM